MTIPDRILGALRALIREEVSGRSGSAGAAAGPAFVPWEYAVIEATDSTVTARRADSSCPWPDMVQIPIYPGIAGARYRPAVGSIVGVAFANGDPSKPRIVWADQTVPVTAAMDATSEVTIGASLTPLVSSASNVCVSPGLVPAPPQEVALAPAVQSFATASITLATAIGVFAQAVELAVPAVSPAGSTLQSACTAFASAVGALSGSFPTGFAATKLTTQ